MDITQVNPLTVEPDYDTYDGDEFDHVIRTVRGMLTDVTPRDNPGLVTAARWCTEFDQECMAPMATVVLLTLARSPGVSHSYLRGLVEQATDA